MPEPLAARRPRWSVRRQVVVFLLLTVVLSWRAWPLTLLHPTSTALVPIGPSIAAVVCRSAPAGGRRAVAALLRQLVRLARAPRVVRGCAARPSLSSSAPSSWPTGRSAPLSNCWRPSPDGTCCRCCSRSGSWSAGRSAEELGWRGFLLPLLMERHGALVASLLVAPLWFAFHLPAMLSGPATEQRPVLSFLLWVVMAVSAAHLALAADRAQRAGRDALPRRDRHVRGAAAPAVHRRRLHPRVVAARRVHDRRGRRRRGSATTGSGGSVVPTTRSGFRTSGAGATGWHHPDSRRGPGHGRSGIDGRDVGGWRCASAPALIAFS